MKILQLIQKPQLRGAELFACQLATNLKQQGNEVSVVAVFEGNATLPFKGKYIALNRPLQKRLFDVQGWKQLARLINADQPDVVQANAGDTLKYAVLSKLMFRWKAPIVFRNASTISLYIKRPWVKWWNAFLFRHITHVVSVSETSRKDFMQLFPFIKERISVIGVGIECNLLSYQKRLHNVVLHVGGFTFEKNHKRLLIIFQQLWQQQPALELWLVGDGPLRKEVEQQAVAMQLSNVKFLGYRSDVLTLMQQATVVVLPSIIEGLPGVILEAMYCQTPVVAYDVGGISEVVKHGETGWLITKKDEEAFVTAVRQVLEGKQVEQVTQQAHQLVVHDFDNKVIAKRFEEVYRTVTSKERAQY